MTTIRQDAWTADEDLILAEVVLRHIREGSTQLAAFEEIAERLSRTSAACGFRWNSTIRKKYESAIALAKKQRSKNKKGKAVQESKWQEETSEELTAQESPVEQVEQKPEQETEPASAKAEPVTLTMEQVIDFLHEYHKNQQQAVAKDVESLKQENEALKQELEKVKEDKRIMAEDYRALLSIMDRARKMSGYQHASES
ncbi:RsfA family transcriptional regulator [Alkalihalobacillus oceani]|uniref:RsfA family transcriptional regulator n=1 Tax=Halalkalibacter oceani TaxID=1653776 RepID=A0A9X2ILP5_9BACI|nr:RsfA family transcriptional regulator [Halalkalibacter oceani]MCM3713089.1 RsfA family transcriptional regulator [Halalkalibacter oceani]